MTACMCPNLKPMSTCQECAGAMWELMNTHEDYKPGLFEQVFFEIYDPMRIQDHFYLGKGGYANLQARNVDLATWMAKSSLRYKGHRVLVVVKVNNWAVVK